MMNSGVTVLFISKALSGLMGLWLSVQKGERDSFKFYTEWVEFTAKIQATCFIWDIPRYPVCLGEDHEPPIGLLLYLSASCIIACIWKVVLYRWEKLSTISTLKDGHLPQSIPIQVKWDISFFLVVPLQKKIENPDCKNENRRPPFRQEQRVHTVGCRVV